MRSFFSKLFLLTGPFYFSCGHENQNTTQTKALVTSPQESTVFVHSESFDLQFPDEISTLKKSLQPTMCVYTGSFQEQPWQESQSFTGLKGEPAIRMMFLGRPAWVSRHTPFPINPTDVDKALSLKRKQIGAFLNTVGAAGTALALGGSYMVMDVPGVLFAGASLWTVYSILKFGESLKDATVPNRLGDLNGKNALMGLNDQSRVYTVGLSQIQEVIDAIDGAAAYYEKGDCKKWPLNSYPIEEKTPATFGPELDFEVDL